jgi:hypothetical protein
MTALPGVASSEQCAYPGCQERPRPRVPGRSGPPPRYCGNPAHTPETARQARARATSDKTSRIAATAAALAEDVVPEGRVRQLVRQWAVATREAAVALDHYRDDATVEARITQATAEVQAALAAQLRAEEQGRLGDHRAVAAEERVMAAEGARQAAEQRAQKAQADAEERIAAAEAEAMREVHSAAAAQREAETARDEAERQRRVAEQVAHDAERDQRAATRQVEQAQQAAQRARENAAGEHDALVRARAEWSVTERTLRETVSGLLRERDAALEARDGALTAAATAQQQARDAEIEQAEARRAERAVQVQAEQSARQATAAEQARQAAVTDAAVAHRRAEDAERRAAESEAGARTAAERVGALSAEVAALRARIEAVTAGAAERPQEVAERRPARS